MCEIVEIRLHYGWEFGGTELEQSLGVFPRLDKAFVLKCCINFYFFENRGYLL